MTSIPGLLPGSKLTIQMQKPKTVRMHSFLDLEDFQTTANHYGIAIDWPEWVCSPRIGSEQFYKFVDEGVIDPEEVRRAGAVIPPRPKAKNLSDMKAVIPEREIYAFATRARIKKAKKKAAERKRELSEESSEEEEEGEAEEGEVSGDVPDPVGQVRQQEHQVQGVPTPIAPVLVPVFPVPTSTVEATSVPTVGTRAVEGQRLETVLDDFEQVSRATGRTEELTVIVPVQDGGATSTTSSSSSSSTERYVPGTTASDSAHAQTRARRAPTMGDPRTTFATTSVTSPTNFSSSSLIPMRAPVRQVTLQDCSNILQLLGPDLISK